MTCAHVVYNRKTSIYPESEWIVGLNENESLYQCKIEKVIVHPQYFEWDHEHSDLALLKLNLDKNFGIEYGWASLRVIESDEIKKELKVNFFFFPVFFLI